MRIAPAVLVFSLFGLSPILRGETLGAVLSANKLSPNLIPENDRQQPITSFAVSTENSRFLLAYYDDNGSGGLPPVLHVLRYDRQTEDLRRTDLNGIEIPIQIVHEVMTQVSSNCMGSALNISEKVGLIIIHTHINPSAGCALILTSDLGFIAGLGGGVLATIDGNIIFVENTIHFAPTHPARVSAYNLQQKKLTPIYPMENYSARKQFSSELQNHLPKVSQPISNTYRQRERAKFCVRCADDSRRVRRRCRTLNQFEDSPLHLHPERRRMDPGLSIRPTTLLRIVLHTPCQLLNLFRFFHHIHRQNIFVRLIHLLLQVRGQLKQFISIGR